MPPPTWQQLFCDLLCKIYIIWGAKNCDDLGCEGSQDDASATVIGLYNTNGLPGGMTNTQKCTLLGDLNNLEANLALPGNTLQAQTTTDLGTMISGLRTDIGLLPGCPN